MLRQALLFVFLRDKLKKDQSWTTKFGTHDGLQPSKGQDCLARKSVALSQYLLV